LFKQQPDLPKLPVPDLEKTLARYLEAIQPILSPGQFQRAQELARQLAENEGPELQHHLVERQISMHNWVRTLQHTRNIQLKYNCNLTAWNYILFWKSQD